MITYEANVICDGCKNQCVTGEPDKNHMETVRNAEERAKRWGWSIEWLGWSIQSGRWLCPNCQRPTNPKPPEPPLDYNAALEESERQIDVLKRNLKNTLLMTSRRSAADCDKFIDELLKS